MPMFRLQGIRISFSQGNNHATKSFLCKFVAVYLTFIFFRQSLKKYVVNLNSVCVLMANEFTGSQKKYYNVNTKKTLRDFLLGKTIVEYPSFVVTLEEFLGRYQLISEAEETELAALMHERRLSKFCLLKSNSNDRTAKSNGQAKGEEDSRHSKEQNCESNAKGACNGTPENRQSNEKMDSNLEDQQMDVTGHNKIGQELKQSSHVNDELFSGGETGSNSKESQDVNAIVIADSTTQLQNGDMDVAKVLKSSNSIVN